MRLGIRRADEGGEGRKMRYRRVPGKGTRPRNKIKEQDQEMDTDRKKKTKSDSPVTRRCLPSERNLPAKETTAVLLFSFS